MAEFCTECTKELFGEEIESDFKGILLKEEFEKGQVLSVLCEGCGYIEVDHLGNKQVDRDIPREMCDDLLKLIKTNNEN